MHSKVMMVLAQTEYGEHPYMYHIQQVMDEVLKMIMGNKFVHHFMDDNLLHDELIDLYLTCAIGHDIIEDTNVVPYDMVELGIPYSVIIGILGVTKVDGESQEEYITKVCSNPMSLFIKIADSHCNMTQSVKDGDKKWSAKYAKLNGLLLEKWDELYEQ